MSEIHIGIQIARSIRERRAFKGRIELSDRYDFEFFRKVVIISSKVIDRFINRLREKIGNLTSEDLSNNKEIINLNSRILSLMLRDELLKMETNLSEDEIEVLRNLDIRLFKDYNNFITSGSLYSFIDTLPEFLRRQLTDEEIIFLVLYNEIVAGIQDAVGTLFYLFSINKYLAKRKIEFDYMSFLYTLALNNIPTLGKIKDRMKSSDFEIQEILDDLETSREEGRGCPFFLFSADKVKIIINLTNELCQKFYDYYLPRIEEGQNVDNYDGFNYFFLEFQFEREALLESRFFKEIPK